ncbi:glycosyltransferase family 4 protein [Bosea sp. TAF32]|uniref:glycosyltransferase family 4 protein n=1 Tax=Bosea sp. TAF32 TaxID=3237482 RepID=UPI003F93827B
MAEFQQVIFVSPGGRLQGGGLGTMTREMEAGLIAAGKRTHVLNTRSEGTVLKSLYETPAAAAAFTALLMVNRRSVVHVQLTQRLSVLREGMFVLLARAFGTRVILHHHGAEFPDFIETASPLWKRIARKVCQAASVNVVLGNVWKSVLRDKLNIADDKIALVQNAIRLAGRKPRNIRREPGQPLQLVLLANLTPRKGVREALLALAELRKAGLNVRLTLAGGGMIAHFEQMARELGVEDCCDFLGWIDRTRMWSVIDAADIMIVPSHQEGFPMSIIEAFAAHLPVVTTPVGAIPETLKDGFDCLFVPVGDHAALANAVARLESDEALRQLLAENAYRTFRRELSHDAMIARMMHIWQGPRGSESGPRPARAA